MITNNDAKIFLNFDHFFVHKYEELTENINYIK